LLVRGIIIIIIILIIIIIIIIMADIWGSLPEIPIYFI